MKYHNITKDDMLNGDGLRVVLWVAGCEHHCKGCQNPVTWNPDDGLEFGAKEIMEICEQLDKDYISGITLSGGDPLYPKNRAEITKLCDFIKTYYSNKTIWCYTGYLLEEVKDLPMMKFVDVLVDGEFVEELADINYKWCGSINQNVWRKNGENWKKDNC